MTLLSKSTKRTGCLLKSSSKLNSCQVLACGSYSNLLSQNQFSSIINNHAIFRSFSLSNSFQLNAEGAENADNSSSPLPEEVQSYLEKNCPISLQQGETLQSELLKKMQSTDFSDLLKLPQENPSELQTKWFKAMERISTLRTEVMEQFGKEFNGDQEKMKVWLGRLSNHSDAIKDAQTEVSKLIAQKIFGLDNYENLITDSRTIGIFYQADRIVQQELLQREEFASKSVKEFASGKVFDADFQKTVLFPRLFEEEMKLLKVEQDEQNEYRADIRQQVEEARKEFEEKDQEFNLIEGADKIQQELSDMSTPKGWITYKIHLGQAYYACS